MADIKPGMNLRQFAFINDSPFQRVNYDIQRYFLCYIQIYIQEILCRIGK